MICRDDHDALPESALRLLHLCGPGQPATEGDLTVELIKDSPEYRVVLLTAGESRSVLKQAGRLAREQKMFNGVIASALAHAAGVPTPTLRSFFCGTATRGSATQWFDYVPGASCEHTLADFSAEEQSRLFADLGMALGRLHRSRAEGYSEVLHLARHSTLERTVNDRLAYCFGQQGAFDAIEPHQTNEAKRKVLMLLEQTMPFSVPVLIHGDVGPRNLIERDRRLAALIDFEHAKFHDAAYDFVKLWFLLSERPGDWDALMHHYLATAGASPAFAQRLEMFVGLEILSGLCYWHRTGDHAMYTDYRERLGTWTGERGAGTKAAR